MVSSVFRKITCFLMAVIFLFFSVTFPVYATSVSIPIVASIVGISAAVAIPAIVAGLGVFPETDTSAFDDLCDTVASSLGAFWIVANEVGDQFIKMLQIGDNYFAQRELVSDILRSVHSSGAVTAIPAGYASYNGILLPSFDSSTLLSADLAGGCDVAVIYQELVGTYAGYYYLLLTRGSSNNGYNSAGAFVSSGVNFYAFYRFTGSAWVRTSASNVNSFDLSISSPVVWSNVLHGDPITAAYSATGMAIGSLAESLTDEEYKTWVAEPIIVIADPITSPEDPTKPSEDEDTDISPTVPGSDLETADQHNYLNVFKNNPVSPTWAEYIAAAAAGQLTGQALRELQKQFQEGKTEIQIQDSEIVQTGTQVQVDPSTVPEGVVSGSGSGSGSGNTGTDTAIDPSVYTNPIIKALNTLGDNLLNGIKNFFVPSSDFLTEKVEALRSEFEFADSIISSGEEIGAALGGLGGEPPVIYAHLGNAEGSLNWGGTVAILDMSWYSRYKPTVDTLISSLMWLAFSWRCFVKLPGFISGVPGDFVMDIIVDLGMESHLPSRKKEYVLQRRDNRRLKP